LSFSQLRREGCKRVRNFWLSLRVIDDAKTAGNFGQFVFLVDPDYINYGISVLLFRFL
jgi:hypothetical protein